MSIDLNCNPLQNPVILLDELHLSKLLQKDGLHKVPTVHVLTTIDSTNRYVKELPLDFLIKDSKTQGSTIQLEAICCAEKQTQGRGRFGRQWHSPFGENIYCSSRWNLKGNLSRISALSLITSLAVLATVNEFSPSPDIQIKWPNDILWKGKKLSGSLIELSAESPDHAQLIIGIGLNVNSDTANQSLSDIPWCSLFEISQQHFNRNTIIARLIINLNRYIQEYRHCDRSGFMSEWKHYDYLAGKHITVIQSLTSISGIAKGITPEGLLILEDDQGVVHQLASGDTTINGISSG